MVCRQPPPVIQAKHVSVMQLITHALTANTRLWDCPIAAAVVAEMCTCLGIPHPLQRYHVWLMHMSD
jgi:hypothetical protein